MPPYYVRPAVCMPGLGGECVLNVIIPGRAVGGDDTVGHCEGRTDVPALRRRGTPARCVVQPVEMLAAW